MNECLCLKQRALHFSRCFNNSCFCLWHREVGKKKKKDLNLNSVVNKTVTTGNSLNFFWTQFHYFLKNNLGKGIWMDIMVDHFLAWMSRVLHLTEQNEALIQKVSVKLFKGNTVFNCKSCSCLQWLKYLLKYISHGYGTVILSKVRNSSLSKAPRSHSRHLMVCPEIWIMSDNIANFLGIPFCLYWVAVFTRPYILLLSYWRIWLQRSKCKPYRLTCNYSKCCLRYAFKLLSNG